MFSDNQHPQAMKIDPGPFADEPAAPHDG